MSVKFSVIVPVYNCMPYLSACTESIFAQTEPDFELLLIDDGSTDNSGDFCDRLAAREPRVRVFHKENGGASSARNLGLEQAVGQYAVFVDGDDLLEPETLEQLSRVLKKGRLVIFGMSFDYYAGDRLARTELLSAAHSGVFSVEALAAQYHAFFEDNALSSACNKLFDLELIRSKGLRYQEGMTLYEDYAFVLRYLAHVDEICCLEHSFYHYRLSVQENHLHERVDQLNRLEWNMSCLLDAAEPFGSRLSSRTALNSSLAETYMRLLSLHLLLHHYGARALAQAAVPYCDNRSFRALLAAGGGLSGEEAALLRRLDEGRFAVLALHFKKKVLPAENPEGRQDTAQKMKPHAAWEGVPALQADASMDSCKERNRYAKNH